MSEIRANVDSDRAFVVWRLDSAIGSVFLAACISLYRSFIAVTSAASLAQGPATSGREGHSA